MMKPANHSISKLRKNKTLGKGFLNNHYIPQKAAGLDIYRKDWFFLSYFGKTNFPRVTDEEILESYIKNLKCIELIDFQAESSELMFFLSYIQVKYSHISINIITEEYGNTSFGKLRDL